MSSPRDHRAPRSEDGPEIELAAPITASRVRPPALNEPGPIDELELDLRQVRSDRPPSRRIPPPPEATPTRRNAIVEIEVPDRTPDAQGSLAQTPLAHVLVSVASRSLSGSVVVFVGDDVHALVFREGVLERMASPLAPLGEILATLGTIDEDEVEFAVHRAAQQGTALGAQLVADGLAQPETIATAVVAQTEERLTALAGLPGDTAYAFFAKCDVLASYPVDVQAMDPLPAVMACVRGMYEEAPMDKVLDALGERRLAFHASAQLPRFGLTKDEAKAAEIIQWSWRPYAELVETLDDGHAALKRVAYALAITKHFDFDEGSWPLGVPRPPSRTPRPPPPEPVPTAPAAAPSLPTAPLTRPPMTITPVSGLRAADAGTPPPTVRTSSPSVPPSGAPLDASALAAMSADDRTIEAASLRQRAEVLLSRNDLAGAEKAAALSVELHRENADGLALLGWLRSMKPGASAIADGVKLLDEAIVRSPSSDRALFYRGSLHKRANRPEDAIRDFRLAAELNPKNIDAMREVRLHTIRSGGSEKAGTKRLIGKLFGK